MYITNNGMLCYMEGNVDAELQRTVERDTTAEGRDGVRLGSDVYTVMHGGEVTLRPGVT